MKKLLWIFVCLPLWGIALPCWSADSAYVLSIPFSISEEKLYKVRIERIDGRSVPEQRTYSLPPGQHVVDLSLKLELHWENAEGPLDVTGTTLPITLTLEEGVQYELAGRVNLEATDEQVVAGNYWNPVVYRKRSAK